jgi:hypothetical protein
VQALLSLHVVPLGAAVCTQPVVGLQVSTVHGLPSSQSVGLVPPQLPDVQVSPVVQALLSLQLVPLSGPQTPLVLHDWQSFGLPPPQVLVQQTLSTQIFVSHIPGRVQGSPGGRSWSQLPAVVQK